MLGCVRKCKGAEQYRVKPEQIKAKDRQETHVWKQLSL